MPHRRNGKWIDPTAELFLGLHDDPDQGLLFDYAGSLEEPSTPPAAGRPAALPMFPNEPPTPQEK